MINVAYGSLMARAEGSSTSEGMVTIKDAARLLGVSEVTLRRWDDAGRFKAIRHPINGYRLYRMRDLTRLKRMIEGRASSGR